MATKLNITVTNPELAASTPLDEEIIAAAAFQDWWQADALHSTLVGSKVSVLASRSSSGRDLGQVTDAERATLTNSAIGAYPALSFAGGQVYSTPTPDPELPLTWAIIYKQTVVENATLFSSRTDATNQTRFALTDTGNAQFVHGSGNIGVPHRAGEWNLVIMGHDTTNVFLSVNGGEYVSGPTDNAGGGTTRVLGALNGVLSNPFTGLVADVVTLTGAPLSNAEIVGKIKSFARSVYGISVA